MTIAPEAFLAAAHPADDDAACVAAVAVAGRGRRESRPSDTPAHAAATLALVPMPAARSFASAAPPAPPTTTALPAMSATATRAALAELYAAHARAIQRFLRDLLGDATLAADATQETFARAFRRMATLREHDKRLPWLFGIARNVALEQRKARRAANSRISPDSAPEAAPCGGRSPEAQLLGREAAAVVEKAMLALPDDRRAALLLRLDHGLAYDEIAAAFGWSLAKAKIEVFRAREVLRATMRTYEGDPR